MNKQSLNYFAKALGADYDFRRDIFTVDCGSVSALPDIVFQIKKAAPASDSMEYRVPATVYAKKVALQSLRALAYAGVQNSRFKKSYLLVKLCLTLLAYLARSCRQAVHTALQ